MADIQDLLARLNSPDAKSDTSTPTANPLAHLFASPAAAPRPPQQISSATREATGSDRTTNLLNLLKFNGAATNTASSGAQKDRRTASASDFMPPFARTESSEARTASLHLSRPSQGESSQRSQDLLLNLLNRSQPSPVQPGTLPSTSASRNGSPAPRLFGNSDENSMPSSFTPPQTKGPAFSYVNPFEQLAAASPRAATPQSDSAQPKPSKMVRKELDHNGVLPGTKSPAASSLPADRSQVEALLGIGAVGQDPSGGSVSHALEEVSGQADRDAKQAIARAETEHAMIQATTVEIEEVAQAVQEAAKDIQQDLKDPTSRAEAVRGMSSNTISGFEQTVDAVADESTPHDWENADAEANPTESTVKVYNFPMRPFVSISIKDSTPSIPRDDMVMRIASLKKEFDQIDRTLATASANFIVYALAKGGGARAIRQDSGDNTPMFRGSENVMFNVAISAPRSSPLSKDSEAVLLTGTKGSVYWTSIPVDISEFERADLDKQGLILPPAPSAEEPTSTAQLKTRAKKSSRHPEFFAVGRGKSIHIVYPNVAMDPEYMDAKTRVVDSTKYFADRCLKVSTGKAGKDFAFSEDDTMLVSLDKVGKLKFWNIVGLTSHEQGLRTGKRPAQVVDTPLLTLLVSMPSDKGSPTSLQFVDKERPTVKGSASRYMLVGLKQNHTIQLWDLGLGKAVQELELPHASDTDAICSIAYHAKTGMIAIGHPTRNSIFLVTLSAPRYNLDMMSQANFISRLAHKDQSLPKPESTAIMSGLREISLASIGELRSLDIMTPTTFTVEKTDPENETVFELYAMHSRGVTCLSVKRKDLGWGPDGKVLVPLDAESEGVISVTELHSSASTDAPPADEALTQDMPKSIIMPKTDSIVKSSTSEETPSRSDNASLPTNGDIKAEKKKNKRRGDDSTDMSSIPTPPVAATTAHASKPAVIGPKMSAPEPVLQEQAEQAPRAVNDVDQIPNDAATTLKETTVGLRMDDVVKASQEAMTPLFGQLYKRIDEERRVQEAAGNSKQDAILRLVSSTLTDNVEKSLERIISANVDRSVAPAAVNAVSSTINQKLAEALPRHLDASLARELKSSLQSAVSNALQSKEVTNAISKQVSDKVAAQVDAEFKTAMHKTIIPAFQNLAVESAREMTRGIESSLGEQIKQADVQRHKDSEKIDGLTSASHELLQTIRVMMQSHSALQQELGQLRQQVSELQRSSTTAVAVEQRDLVADAQDEELDTIRQLMSDGKSEEATIKWLQCGRQSELFDKFFVRCSPEYLRNLNQLVSLSVSMAVSSSLESHVQERLEWLDVVLENIDTQVRRDSSEHVSIAC